MFGKWIPKKELNLPMGIALMAGSIFYLLSSWYFPIGYDVNNSISWPLFVNILA